jgi:hypothetical protein
MALIVFDDELTRRPLGFVDVPLEGDAVAPGDDVDYLHDASNGRSLRQRVDRSTFTAIGR